MGLLDDAIREHLELKRRRGADADEVSRLEQEALGPPQRGEFATAAAPASADDVAVADAPLPPAEVAAPEDDAAAAVQADPAPEPEPADAPVDEPEPRDEAWLEDEPEPPATEPEETGAGVLDQPTVEYAPPPPEAPEGEDVLEETPDFLQETPEHDRLWFEQKPPRDFDLDR